MPLPYGRPKITEDTPGPTLAVLAICSVGISAVVVGGAVAWQLKHRHLAQPSKQDLSWNLMLSLALVVSGAQSIVTAVQVQYGLGYSILMLTQEDVAMFEKYANNLLYIGSLLLLKAVQFMLQLSTTFEKPNHWIPSGAMAGMAAFFFAAAFGCSISYWHERSGTCINQTMFWLCFGVFDILTDIYSITVVLWVTKDLNLRTTSKVKLLTILSSKFLPVLCAIARLPFIPAAFNSTNYTIALYKLGIPTQVQLHLSVMTLSMGKIFRFLSSLNVGYLSSSIEPTRGKGSTTLSQTRVYGITSKSSRLSSGRARKISVDDHGSSKNLVPADYGKTITEIEAIPMRSIRTETSRPSQSSDLVPEQGEHNIVVTTRIEVRSEEVS